MKTLIKRLLGITRLESQLAVRIEELREAYALMHQARDEREVLRERLVKMTQAVPGPWKLTKDKTKRFRKWEYPHSRSMWRTESEAIEQVVEIDGSDYNEEEAAVYWDKAGNAEPPF